MVGTQDRSWSASTCAYRDAPTFIAFDLADKYNPLAGQVLRRH
jgi:hypothetical protein